MVSRRASLLTLSCSMQNQNLRQYVREQESLLLSDTVSIYLKNPGKGYRSNRPAEIRGNNSCFSARIYFRLRLCRRRRLSPKRRYGKRHRWSYKAENINFEKWVRGKELLIVSSPVTQRKNFDLYKTIKKAIELQMSCALLLVGESYVTQIDDKVIDLAEKNDFPLLPCPGMCRFWIFEELGHAISYLDDRKDIEDSLLAEIIFGNSINTTSIEQKCIQMGYEKSVLEQVFVLHIAGNIITNDQIRSYAQTLKDYFKAADYRRLYHAMETE